MNFKQNKSDFVSTPTAPVKDNPFDMQEIGATTPVSHADGTGAGPTVSVDFDMFDSNSVEDYSDETSPVSMDGKEGFTPVVGWLVCVDGPAEGMDYRIRAGYNYIGRDESVDVCILGDNNISRGRHAMIAYDPQDKVYFFGPADGKSIVRKNNRMVMGPTELTAYDVLQIGSTKLMFVPLCGEHFNWGDNKNV